MTIQQAAQSAIDCQNGVNLSGIALSLTRILTEAIWPEARRIGQGTRWVNTHPIVTTYLEKLCQLNEHGVNGPGHMVSAWRAVEAMAEGRGWEGEYTIHGG